ncbi:hypothetical protein BH11PLA2_BH11PLA2_34460 [soil metagenome]
MQTIQTVIGFLQGKKTYIVAFFAVLGAIAGLASGTLAPAAASLVALNGLGFMGLRNALTTELMNFAVQILSVPTPTPPSDPASPVVSVPLPKIAA